MPATRTKLDTARKLLKRENCWSVWSTLALSGFLSMGYEVAWTRVLVFPFASTVYAFTLILVVFLLGLALGSAVFARLDPARHCLPALGLTQILAAAAALGLLPLVLMLPGWIRDHLPGRTTTDLPLHQIASLAGFSDQGRLSKQYRRVKGFAPSAERR